MKDLGHLLELCVRVCVFLCRSSSSLLDIECLRLPGLPFGSGCRFRSSIVVLGALVVSFRS